MREGSSLKTSIVLVVSLVAGALVSAQVKHLRESEAFYRWMIAAAMEERLFDDWGEDFEDQTLYAATQSAAEPLLSDTPLKMTVDDGRVISEIARLAAPPLESDMAKVKANNELLFKVARSLELAATRTQFLQKARGHKLEFAKYEGYIENVHVFNLFFGFRKVAANFIWLQVDRYWHQGMMHRMIPLMKTCVTLDPNFVDAYLLGAWHLGYNATAKMLDTPMPLREWYPQYGACLGEKELYYYMAKDFLEDGIKSNRGEYKLYFDLGFGIYSQKLKDYKNAVKYLTEAVRQPHEVWVPRQLYVNMELNGQYEEALAGWEHYMDLHPGTMTAIDVGPRFVQRNLAHIYERSAEEALVAAEYAVDSDEATAQRDGAKEYRERARQIWDAMSNRDDPYGTARSLRLQALGDAEDGRYIEAIARLDYARYENPSQFDEFSELIVEIKNKGALPLTLSEKKWEKRQEGGDICRGMPTTTEGPV